ncbi:ATP-dependent DNA helicase RecG [Robinsoniella peoriensis]|uniref:ATP-dependent DNA helicase RecG n=1 Tax=Robinsoniella peoriensis TaxID=180332 RepID=UPI0037535295
MMNMESSIQELKGIGEKTVLVFQKAGIRTIDDLLNYYPRNYDTYDNIVKVSEISDDDVSAAVYGTVVQTLDVKRVRRLQITNTVIRDDSGGMIRLTWFNMPYLKNTLKRGSKYIFRGKISRKEQQLLMEQPAVFRVDQYQEMLHVMQPIYTLVPGLTNNMITKAVRQALPLLEEYHDYLPEEIRKEYHLAEFHYAIEQIHFPKDMHDVMLARNRLVFDEFFLFILALRRLKDSTEELYHSFHMQQTLLTDQIIANLKFSLTKAQAKVWKEIEKDLLSPKVMARLVQGDVGSGKTILAILALIMTAQNGYQGSLMVPTEVLAVQHFESICGLLEEQHLDFNTVLLTGSMTAKEKWAVYEKIETGEADIIIGTHALIQEKVNYKNLALVITDEQHRFGVRQREALSEKGELPHVLVMSATPIPRTLAVILYGDLDVSVIDELPANRLPIKNCVVDTRYRPKAYSFIQNEIEEGRQAYIICPMVEESEAIEAENVIEYTERLRAALAENIQIEYLHGKMKPKEKNSIMERFLNHEIDVLVSTTVVEVGVNVPNATVMMIENAERFGLAQLHQLRGRVGRGQYQSYCIMVRASESKKVKERLEILNKSNDGFFIASEDLKLRGPGDVFGVRQSGLLEFKIGDVFTDASILQKASEAAQIILDQGELAGKPEYCYLDKKLQEYMLQGFGRINL